MHIALCPLHYAHCTVHIVLCTFFTIISFSLYGYLHQFLSKNLAGRLIRQNWVLGRITLFYNPAHDEHDIRYIVHARAYRKDNIFIHKYDDSKNEDAPKNEDNPKNEDAPKNEDTNLK